MSSAASAPLTPEPPGQSNSLTAGLAKTIKRAAFGIVGAFALLFVIGLIFALTGDPNTNATHLQSIRNVLLIVMILEGIFILGALTLLILQIVRLINMLQQETKPAIQQGKETLQTTQNTVKLVGKSVVSPIIRVSTFAAGAKVFVREVGGIRKAIRRTKKADKSA